MAPKESKTILLDRRESSVSTLSRASSWSNETPQLGPALAMKAIGAHEDNHKSSTVITVSRVSWTCKQNLLISLLIFVVGVFRTDLFLPNHEHVFTREHPYQTTRQGDVILNSELNYLLVYPASVPSRVLFRTCVLLPLGIVALVYVRSRSWNCAMTSVSGLLAAIGICEVWTHVLKHYVLRRRPNFYALCGWEGTECIGSPSKILESQLSFPSGHSSISWCGMTFLSLVLLGKLQLAQPCNSQRWKQWSTWLVCLLPWSWSSYVATSRIADNWHHASDVIAGTLLGIVCAAISYHSVFPHIFSMDAGTSFTELDARKNR